MKTATEDVMAPQTVLNIIVHLFLSVTKKFKLFIPVVPNVSGTMGQFYGIKFFHGERLGARSWGIVWGWFKGPCKLDRSSVLFIVGSCRYENLSLLLIWQEAGLRQECEWWRAALCGNEAALSCASLPLWGQVPQRLQSGPRSPEVGDSLCTQPKNNL